MSVTPKGTKSNPSTAPSTPNRSQQSRIYLDCPHQHKDQVKALGAQYDGDLEMWYYYPNGINDYSFDKWSLNNNANVYINCPFSQKDEAKQLGARWDGRHWYIKEKWDKTPFKKWIVPSSYPNSPMKGKNTISKDSTPLEAPFTPPRQVSKELNTPVSTRIGSNSNSRLYQISTPPNEGDGDGDGDDADSDRYEKDSFLASSEEDDEDEDDSDAGSIGGRSSGSGGENNGHDSDSDDLSNTGSSTEVSTVPFMYLCPYPLITRCLFVCLLIHRAMMKTTTRKRWKRT